MVSALEQFDRWLAAHDAEVAAKAWDEGHLAHGRWIPTPGACRISGGCAATNPYRTTDHTDGS